MGLFFSLPLSQNQKARGITVATSSRSADRGAGAGEVNGMEGWRSIQNKVRERGI
jgi:hypothetical protein